MANLTYVLLKHVSLWLPVTCSAALPSTTLIASPQNLLICPHVPSLISYNGVPLAPIFILPLFLHLYPGPGRLHLVSLALNFVCILMTPKSRPLP
jgi:hypothetical protein